MKRLKFKKPFNGVENALKLIPESYKVNGKEFEITDGNETYRVKWDSRINEATLLTSSNKTMINEDMQKMKHLMGFKSEETLGNLKGSQRIDENKKFGDVWNKTKGLLKEMTGGYGFNNQGNLEGHDEIENLDDSLKEEDIDNGVPSQAKIGQELKAKGASINDANFNGKERGVVGKLLNIIDKLSQESNGFSSQVMSKLDALVDAVDNAIAQGKSAEGDETQGGFTNEGGVCHECGDEEIVGEMDRFDEVFEGMNEEDKEFPDLTGDGKVTQADILKGRGVFEENNK